MKADLVVGIRKTTPVTDVGTTATKIWTLSENRSAKVRKLWAHNETTTDVRIYLCKSDGTRLSPDILVPAERTVFASEDELPSMEFYEDIYIIATATGVRALAEVEEIG